MLCDAVALVAVMQVGHLVAWAEGALHRAPSSAASAYGTSRTAPPQANGPLRDARHISQPLRVRLSITQHARSRSKSSPTYLICVCVLYRDVSVKLLALGLSNSASG